MARIALLLREPLLVDLLQHVFSQYETIDCHGQYSHCHQALENLSAHPADIVIADLLLPGPSGVYFAKHYRKIAPECKVILLTDYLNAFLAAYAENKNINGVYSKYANTADFIEFMNDVFDGKVFTNVISAFKNSNANTLLSLTPSEIEIIISLIHFEIPRQMRADLFGVKPSSIDSLVRNSYKKLGVQNKGELLEWAREQKFKLDLPFYLGSNN